MNTIGERIKMIIESEKMNEFSFSKRIGKSNTAVAKIVKGESKPGFEVIEAILTEFPMLNSDWLIQGTGQMLKSEQKDSIKAGAYLQDYLQKLENQFAEMKDMFSSQIAVKDRQIEKLMDLLGKLDVGENTTCKIVDFLPPMGAQIA